MSNHIKYVCPIMSSGEKIVPCMENCAWYNASMKKCSMCLSSNINSSLKEITDSLDNIYNLLGMAK